MKTNISEKSSEQVGINWLVLGSCKVFGWHLGAKCCNGLKHYLMKEYPFSGNTRISIIWPKGEKVCRIRCSIRHRQKLFKWQSYLTIVYSGIFWEEDTYLTVLIGFHHSTQYSSVDWTESLRHQTSAALSHLTYKQNIWKEISILYTPSSIKLYS